MARWTTGLCMGVVAISLSAMAFANDAGTPAVATSSRVADESIPLPLRALETTGLTEFQYAGAESDIAQTTERLRALDVRAARLDGWSAADEVVSAGGRSEPIAITDAVPEAIREQFQPTPPYSGPIDPLLMWLMHGKEGPVPEALTKIRVIGTMINHDPKHPKKGAWFVIPGYGEFTAGEGTPHTLASFELPKDTEFARVEVMFEVAQIEPRYVGFDFYVTWYGRNGEEIVYAPVRINSYVRETF